jgi:hypothetical protein
METIVASHRESCYPIRMPTKRTISEVIVTQSDVMVAHPSGMRLS